MSIKNAKFKFQPSAPMLAFASMRNTPFMEIDDKGERLDKDMKDFLWGKDCFGERDDIEHGYGQRGSNIEECKGIKHSWTREAHK
jgi:hypothetical protein